MKKIPFYFLLAVFFASCNATKHVAEGEFMLTENSINIDSVKTKSSNLQKYILQKRNPRFLGLPLSLYFHNLGNHEKPETPTEWAEENSKSYNFVKKVFSEKQSIAYSNYFINLNKWFLKYPHPEIVSNNKVKRTADNLWAYYKTQGFFRSSVNSKISKDSADKKATVTYYIKKGKPTLLDTIHIKIESPVLDSIYRNSGLETLLKTNDQYKDQVFRNEASKVVKLFRNNGVYHFAEAALGFYVDSTRTDYKTNVDFIIAKNRLIEENGQYKEKPYKIHTIKEVNVITDYSFTRKDESPTNSVSYNGINFLSYNKLKYSPKYLSQSIFLKPGKIYKDTLRNLTRTHLKSLQNFKSTNIKFTADPASENELKMDVFLAPLEKYTLGTETELTHSNVRNLGVSGKFSITDRNAFKGAELLKLSFLGSWFNSNTGPGWEIGADASLEIPRFLAPFGLSKFVPKAMSPRTLFSLGSSFQKNIGLDRQTFTILTDYKWQYNDKKTIQLEILNTQYIQNLNVNSFFTIYNSEYESLNSVAKVFYNDANRVLNLPEEAVSFMNTLVANNSFQNTNPEEYNISLNILNRYNIITSDFLIPTIAYTFTYNSQRDFKDNNFSFFKIRVANSGNVLGLLSDKENANNKKTFLNIPLAQYFKTDIEFKKFWDVGNNSVFGFRTFLGAIITYDNSDVPFTKSYFAGGSNDIRAWQTYELGPGSRNSGLEFNVGNFKFLTSAEYRFDVVSKLKGALFIDAGNIWDISGSSFIEEEAKFTNLSSLKNIAVGSGFGARLDFNFLILRFDVGFKTYEPYLDGNKWFKNYSFNDAVYNVGINYPF
ncbi:MULTISPECIES: BamA/TamA family outer membrane protein [unclassified Polaribacter]|uniref:translocation and assembly module lipoprotein TamL n=1 Tax=unclassified Polaribacter TaxID=196858 RepID=UPI0011BFCD45|nr:MULTISPECIES: BamA/TamA family outer membrane protein [unclassified Polaribacter]TXD54142.1 BamA/TamA family outer membrane protein [Polaribacter sp. IC063]TXD62407.1 BamA/TamA family outer membrane protein [Polaribacter sp. IC066]